MNDQKSARPDQQIVDQAIAWVLQREAGQTPEQALELVEWLQSDDRHLAAFARAESTLKLLDEMPTVRDELEDLPVPQKASGALLRFPRQKWVMAIAASLVLIGAVFFNLRNRTETLDYAATSSSPAYIDLPDGSKVILNRESRMLITLSEGRRQVELTGEAHFDVAPDPSRPFVVISSGINVRAVGTAFNVRPTSRGIEVLVTEGKVRVGSEDAPDLKETQGALVSEGEIAFVPAASDHSPSTARIEKVGLDLIQEKLAWHARVITFSDAPLSEIVAEFNRYNHVKMQFSDPELGAYRVGGAFTLNRVEAFVRVLEQDGEIIAEKRDGVLYLRRAR